MASIGEPVSNCERPENCVKREVTLTGSIAHRNSKVPTEQLAGERDPTMSTLSPGSSQGIILTEERCEVEVVSWRDQGDI